MTKIMTKSELLRRTLGDLNKIYKLGLYEFVFSKHPGLYAELQTLESRIDEAYLYKPYEVLRQALREYWMFHVRAIELYENASIPIDIDKTKQEMSGQRLNA